MNVTILSYILYYSALFNLDPNLVKAVVSVESSGDITMVGEAGELGLMQLLPSSFPHKKLKDPKVNVALGTAYLKKVRDECIHKEDFTFLVCYNLGVAGGRKVKHPKLWPYYKKVMKEYRRLNNETQDLPIQTSK